MICSFTQNHTYSNSGNLSTMKIKLTFLIAFGFLLLIRSYAQNAELRIELDLKNDYKDEKVYPMGENGFLLQSFEIKANGGLVGCRNDFYSTNFKLIKSVTVPVKERTLYTDSFDENGVNYTMIRNRRDYFAIVTSNANNQECIKTEGKLADLGVLSEMKVSGGKAVFKCTGKRGSSLLIVELKSGKSKYVPVKVEKFTSKALSVLDFQVFDEEILVFINAITDKIKEDLYIAILDLEGRQKEVFNVTKTVKEKLITAAATKIQNRYVITGTYSKTRSDKSQGVFIGEIENKKLNFTKFYNFLELKNFTGYLSQKKQDRIERKKNSKAEKGEELLMNYSIVTHPLIECADGYIFLGEAFYPTYTTYTTQMATGTGGVSTQVHTVFDGYQYTHATLAKFDRSGNLIWDNTFAMWPIYKPFRIKKFISFRQGQETAELAFSERNIIWYKVFNQNDGWIIRDNSKEIIETDLEGDKVRRSFSNIDYWYDNNFIAYGIQSISNKEVKRSRKVFFVNNISFSTF